MVAYGSTGICALTAYCCGCDGRTKLGSGCLGIAKLDSWGGPMCSDVDVGVLGLLPIGVVSSLAVVRKGMVISKRNIIIEQLLYYVVQKTTVS